ncbi:PcfJ domain-containing protein [Lysinibacillus sphaericus]|uniref:PcfJ domain-containing protein n=1 Tax=Lysinibacillus sphaericus TaxID=1421 RepID=UPI0021624167|nr:PcfJ domain-containing protein [Lysinibacillus sphaericus]MCS1383241.1 PcfJ domain-containing protein [Lysinibacillus sphaericus]
MNVLYVFQNVSTKKEWLGRKTLIDTACILHCQKSVLDPYVVTVEWLYVSRDYREDFKNVSTEYTAVARYVYDYENKICQKIECGWRGQWWVEGGFSTPSFLQNRGFMSRRIMNETFEDGISGTPFQYSGWQRYDYEAVLKYLPLVAKYPSVEILTKAGLENFVLAKIYGHKTFSAINWSQSKLHHIFKMSKQDFQLLREDNLVFSLYHTKEFLFKAWVIQQWRKEKSKMNIDELQNYMKSFAVIDDMKTLNFIRKFASIHRLFNYANKQFEKDEKHFIRRHQVLITWRDYLMDCQRLKIHIDDAIIFPKSLRKAHEETIKRVKHYEDELMRKKAKERYEKIKHYEFELGQLKIVVPYTPKEIIDEGNKLSHCVGGYAQRHVDGKTTILFIRNIKEPDESFYTLEVKNEKVLQVRGVKNKPATEDVQTFIEEFKKQKLIKKARKAV